jgi:uncharacterized membrane protein
MALSEIGIIGCAYEKRGVQRRSVFAVLLLSLLGSYLNIPVTELPAKQGVSGQEGTFFCITAHGDEAARAGVASRRG